MDCTGVFQIGLTIARADNNKAVTADSAAVGQISVIHIQLFVNLQRAFIIKSRLYTGIFVT